MISKAVPNACLFTAGLTFQEFIAQSPRERAIFQLCYQEARVGRMEQEFLVSYPDVHNLAVIVAEDSPDTVVVLPILQRLVEANPRAELRVFDVDEDLHLLDRYLGESLPSENNADGNSNDKNSAEDSHVEDEEENGEEENEDTGNDIDTPLLLILDEEYQLLGQWGPRPQAAEARLDRWLDAHPEYEILAEDDSDEAQLAYGELLDTLTLEMRVWYNSGLTRNCVEEVVGLMKELQSTDEESEPE